jgi:uncharacterized RDD family membrane protein YckC
LSGEKVSGDPLPEPSTGKLEWTGVRLWFNAVPDSAPLEGVLWRRSLAFLIDMAIVGAFYLMMWMIIIFSLGLLSGVLLPFAPLIPIAYHTLLIGGQRSATIGMQFLGMEVRTLDGDRPGLIQAFAMTALFYLSVTTTSFLILIIAFFNDKNRCAHDFLSGTLVVNLNAEFPIKKPR